MPLLAFCLSALVHADPEAFLTRPDIHGDKVVFTAEGDLWIASVSTGEARRLTSDPGLESWARFSPDGQTIAFTANYEGSTDVYVIPVDGGVPKRLTYNPRRAHVMGWTPDGKNVVYRAPDKHWTNYLNQFFTVPVTGGLPKMVPVPRAEFGSFNADGSKLAFVQDSNEWMNWFRYEGGEADKIRLFDTRSGKFELLTNAKGIDTQPVWVGSDIYFVSERSGVRNLWRLDPSTKRVEQATFSTGEPARYPGSDGRRIVFELGPRLAVFDPSTKSSKVIDVHLRSDRIHQRPQPIPVADSIEELGIGPTGKRVVVVARGQLLTLPASEGEVRSLSSTPGVRIMSASWSPDGKRIAFISDATGEEQLFVMDATGANTKQLTKDWKGEHFSPVWSPDNKNLLVGDREMRILLIDVATGTQKVVDQADRSGSYDQTNQDFCFSPDGRFVAYAKLGFGWLNSVWLYSLETGKSTQISEPSMNSTSPAFSPDGKYLYMIQARQLDARYDPFNAMISFDNTNRITAVALAADTPSPFAPKSDDEGAEAPKEPEAAKAANGLPLTKVDLDGIANRMIDMRVKAGRYSSLQALPGKLLFLSKPGSDTIETPSPTDLVAFDITSKVAAPLASDVSAYEVSFDKQKMLAVGAAGPQIVDANGEPFAAEKGLLKLGGLVVSVDPAAEWRQIFYESWRIGRDFFYDPNMHGVNWNAVKTKYEAQLPLVGDRSDLTRLIGDMIAELNVGHCYVAGDSPYTVARRNMGTLAADFELDPSGKAVKIVKILRAGAWDFELRSPLAVPGVNVKVGDYILEINGKPISRDLDPQALLLGTAGKTITLKVNSKPSPEGSRIIRVVPLASERQIRYEDWVQSRREYVAKATGGQIAYIHVSDMDHAGAADFAKDYYGNVDKAGMIVDVRANGGGFISSNLLNHLATQITGYFKPRYGLSWRREGWAPYGSLVAITDEWAFSDGEYFSEFWKRLKLGPLVGHRTGGGEVGSGGGYRMVDGGTLSIPNYGAWTAAGEWVIEGRGAVPDIEIEQDPALVMQGRDPQLDKAIAILMSKLAKTPFRQPTPPKFPVKLGGSGG